MGSIHKNVLANIRVRQFSETAPAYYMGLRLDVEDIERQGGIGLFAGVSVVMIHVFRRRAQEEGQELEDAEARAGDTKGGE